MIADLVRLLGSGTVDTNTVANYFLAQQLLAALASIKEETTQTIIAKVQSGIHWDNPTIFLIQDSTIVVPEA